MRGSIAKCPVLLPGQECWLLWGSSHLLSWLQSYTFLPLLVQESGPSLLPVSFSPAVILGDAEPHVDSPLRPWHLLLVFPTALDTLLHPGLLVPWSPPHSQDPQERFHVWMWELLTMIASFQLCCSISGNYSLYTSNLPGSQLLFFLPVHQLPLLFTSFLRVLVPTVHHTHPSLKVFLKAEVITLSFSEKKFYFLWELTKMGVINKQSCVCPPFLLLQYLLRKYKVCSTSHPFFCRQMAFPDES